MRSILGGVALIALQASLTALAADTSVIAIRAGRLIDVTTGEIRKDQIIIVRGDRIEAVGGAAALGVPAGGKVIDLSGYAVLPGLIDTHTHITIDPALPPYHAYGLSQPRIALKGAAHAQATLLAGVTTIRDLGATGYTDIALRDAINEGDVPGPRILAAGAAIGITGGHCDDNLLAPEFDERSAGAADGVDGRDTGR